jgi:phytanoyl-CoA dioxygenase PhyH
MTKCDTSSAATDVENSFKFSAAEEARIRGSLCRNGLAVIRNFIPASDLHEMQATARASTERGFAYGRENGCKISASANPATREFSQPFVLSSAATRLVTSPALLDVIESALGDKAIIHHGLFQRSLPIKDVALDWHIDTGSNKILNGRAKFEDFRVRLIVYLTDVTNGGFSYIVESSRDALATFFPLPPYTLFPEDQVPEDQSRRVTCNEPAGTIILFDTHGLHRPEAPTTERMVLNVWFARNDFKAKLPSSLVSISLVPPEQRDRLYVFANERGFSPLETGKGADQPTPFVKRVVRKIARTVGARP